MFPLRKTKPVCPKVPSQFLKVDHSNGGLPCYYQQPSVSFFEETAYSVTARLTGNPPFQMDFKASVNIVPVTYMDQSTIRCSATNLLM